MQDMYLRTPDEESMKAALTAAGLLSEEGSPIGCAIDMIGAIESSPGYHTNVRVADKAGLNLSEVEAWRIYPAAPVRVFAGALPSPNAQELRAKKWGEIKAERDRRKAGGVKVGDYWFHSDDASRIQQLGLVLMGAGIPTDLQWKTMTSEFVTMTLELAQQVFSAVAASDQAIFAIAEQHKDAMKKSSDPANYDFSAGWPPIFGE